jgi:hypothetical protein
MSNTTKTSQRAKFAQSGESPAPDSTAPQRRSTAQALYTGPGLPLTTIGERLVQRSALRLSFLPANQAYTFRFGDSLLRLEGEPQYYATRAAAVAAAKRAALRVDRYGNVTLTHEAPTP